MAEVPDPFDDRTSVETQRLAEFVQDTPAAEIPTHVRHESARCLLDFVGLAVAGSSEAASDIARRQCLALGGEGTVPVLGTGTRLRATDAALVNGISAHALDFDDTHVPTILHPTTPLYSTALALSGPHHRGPEVLDAHALGYELAARVSIAMFPEHYDVGWHMTGTTGALASAAVGIRMLGLRGATAVHCLGIAATQAAGHREHFGTMTKPFHAGRAASAGVWAGLLAERGFTAAPDPLQGRRGLLSVMSTAFRADALVSDLGRRWEIEQNGVKPYACGVVIHPAIDAVRDLRVGHGLHPKDVESIELRVHPLVLELTGKTDPRTGLEGKFSVTFAAAIAMLERRAGEREFTDRAVGRADVRDLMPRIQVVPDSGTAHTEARATATVRDGTVVHTEVHDARGTPGNRLSDAELADKFHGLADPVLGEHRADRLEKAVWAIEDGGDVRSMLELTVPA